MEVLLDVPLLTMYLVMDQWSMFIFICFPTYDVLGFQAISINDREHITLVVCIFFKYFNVLT